MFSSSSWKDDFNFLPLFYNILQYIQEGKEELEIIKAINLLNEKFIKSKKIIENLPGTELTREQQEALYKEFQKKLKEKNNLIEKYKNLEIFQLIKE
jgi:hypothetical protein